MLVEQLSICIFLCKIGQWNVFFLLWLDAAEKRKEELVRKYQELKVYLALCLVHIWVLQFPTQHLSLVLLVWFCRAALVFNCWRFLTKNQWFCSWVLSSSSEPLTDWLPCRQLESWRSFLRSVGERMLPRTTDICHTDALSPIKTSSKPQQQTKSFSLDLLGHWSMKFAKSGSLLTSF